MIPARHNNVQTNRHALVTKDFRPKVQDWYFRRQNLVQNNTIANLTTKNITFRMNKMSSAL